MAGHDTAVRFMPFAIYHYTGVSANCNVYIEIYIAVGTIHPHVVVLFSFAVGTKPGKRHPQCQLQCRGAPSWAWLRAVGRRRCRPLAVALGGPGSVLSWAIVGVRAKKPSRGLVFSFPLLYLCGRWVAFRCGRQWPGGSPQRISRCSKLIAIKLCAISEMHGKVRRESVAGYATDETLACGPKEHTRWWQRYRGHLQGQLYRLILNSYLIIKAWIYGKQH